MGCGGKKLGDHWFSAAEHLKVSSESVIDILRSLHIFFFSTSDSVKV